MCWENEMHFWTVVLKFRLWTTRAHSDKAYDKLLGNLAEDMGNLAHWQQYVYRKTSNISRTLVGNKIVDHSDVVGASPVGAAPTTSSFST